MRRAICAQERGPDGRATEWAERLSSILLRDRREGRRKLLAARRIV